jgi:hypothetical protein
MKYFMKRSVVILIALILWSRGNTQRTEYPFYQLYQLDSIGKSPSISRHFGKLYYDFLCLVEKKLQEADTPTLHLVRHFETVFAQFYIDACIAYKNGKQISLPAWRAYFIDTTLESYQYNLLGTNAHLNGGLSEAIAGSYTPEQWKWVKEKYVLFNSCLNKTFRIVYRQTMNNNRRARKLHAVFFGTEKLLGYYYLYKWRKRQMRLTEYRFENSPKYKKLFAKISRKKVKVDTLVITRL